MSSVELSPTPTPQAVVAFAPSDAGRVVVELRGEQDICSVPALSETLARAITLDNADLVIDMSKVQFIDTASVRVIVRARDLLRLESRSLVVRAPSRRAKRVLELCQLGDLVTRRRTAPRLTGLAGGQAATSEPSESASASG